jgi:hypothetical protein
MSWSVGRLATGATSGIPPRCPTRSFRLDGDRWIPHELTRGPVGAERDARRTVAACWHARRAGRGARADAPARLTIELMRPGAARTALRRDAHRAAGEEGAVGRGATARRRRRGRARDAAPHPGAGIPWPARTAGGDTRCRSTDPIGAGDAARRGDDYPAAVPQHGDGASRRVAASGASSARRRTGSALRPRSSRRETVAAQRVAAVADFGNGISSALPYEVTHKFINPGPDDSQRHRLPEGTSGVCLDAVTYPEAARNRRPRRACSTTSEDGAVARWQNPPSGTLELSAAPYASRFFPWTSGRAGWNHLD